MLLLLELPYLFPGLSSPACLLSLLCCPCALQMYRTPFMLRHCTAILIHLGAVVLGPYFQHVAVCEDDWTIHNMFCPAPYVMAVIYSVVCMLLLNVQVGAAGASIVVQGCGCSAAQATL